MGEDLKVIWRGGIFFSQCDGMCNELLDTVHLGTCDDKLKQEQEVVEVDVITMLKKHWTGLSR